MAVNFSAGNAVVFVVGPIKGRNDSNVIVKYPEDTVDGFVTANAALDTPVLGAAKQFTAVAPGIFVPIFSGSEVDDIIADVPAIVAGTTLYCILKGPDLRVATPMIYETARVVE